MSDLPDAVRSYADRRRAAGSRPGPPALELDWSWSWSWSRSWRTRNWFWLLRVATASNGPGSPKTRSGIDGFCSQHKMSASAQISGTKDEARNELPGSWRNLVGEIGGVELC